MNDNISVIPLYTDIYTHTGRAETLDERFTNSPWLDPDIVIYKQQWIQQIGASIRQEALLDNWLRICTVAPFPLGKDFIYMDEFWIEAVSQTVNDYIKQQNEQSNKSAKEMESKLEALKPQQSAFNNIPMPSFHG